MNQLPPVLKPGLYDLTIDIPNEQFDGRSKDWSKQPFVKAGTRFQVDRWISTTEGKPDISYNQIRPVKSHGKWLYIKKANYEGGLFDLAGLVIPNLVPVPLHLGEFTTRTSADAILIKLFEENRFTLEELDGWFPWRDLHL